MSAPSLESLLGYQAPAVIVRRAARMRFERYHGMGAKPLPWSKLTDAQKVPWILRAAADEEEVQQ